MNKVLLTGMIISKQPKKTYSRHDGTEGFIGIFSLRLAKRKYEVVELKTFKEEVFDLFEELDRVYIEGNLSTWSYNEKWYSEVVVHDVQIIGKSTQKSSDSNKSEAVKINESSESSQNTDDQNFSDSPEPIEPIEDSEFDV